MEKRGLLVLWGSRRAVPVFIIAIRGKIELIDSRHERRTLSCEPNELNPHPLIGSSDHLTPTALTAAAAAGDLQRCKCI